MAAQRVLGASVFFKALVDCNENSGDITAWSFSAVALTVSADTLIVDLHGIFSNLGHGFWDRACTEVLLIK